jgi:hypothetical protein
MYRVKLKRKIGRFFSKIEVVSHAQKRNDFFCFQMRRKLATIISEQKNNDLEKKT